MSVQPLLLSPGGTALSLRGSNPELIQQWLSRPWEGRGVGSTVGKRVIPKSRGVLGAQRKLQLGRGSGSNPQLSRLEGKLALERQGMQGLGSRATDIRATCAGPAPALASAVALGAAARQQSRNGFPSMWRPCANPSFATYFLCELGQVTPPFCLSLPNAQTEAVLIAVIIPHNSVVRSSERKLVQRKCLVSSK